MEINKSASLIDMFTGRSSSIISGLKYLVLTTTDFGQIKRALKYFNALFICKVKAYFTISALILLTSEITSTSISFFKTNFGSLPEILSLMAATSSSYSILKMLNLSMIFLVL